MHGIFFITGKLGAGKTLVSVGKIQDYLLNGKPVATNLDLNLDKLLPRNNKSARVIRLPDKPTRADLDALGAATTSHKDDDKGLLVLDELGTWFNSRNFQDKSRQPVIDWFLHARKLGWDCLFIVQDVDLVDKQARISLCEHIVYCRRTDRIPLPFVGWLYRWITGKQITIPRIHVGAVYYGEGQTAVKVGVWVYRGNKFFSAYNTNQIFSSNYENGLYSFLPPYYLKHIPKMQKGIKSAMRITRIYFKRFSRPAFIVLTLVISILINVTLFYGLSKANFGKSDADPQIQEAKIDEIDKISEKENTETHPIFYKTTYKPLNFIAEQEGKYIQVKYIYEGRVVPAHEMPVDVVWRSGRPYEVIIAPSQGNDAPMTVPDVQVFNANERSESTTSVSDKQP
jgi:hypothetical protein